MKIKELTIFSSRIKEQSAFYSEVLELKSVASSGQRVSFCIGNSILHLAYKMEATPYHFAINIPANKEQEALKWLKSRLPILKDGQDEIINFKAWNAKAIYFYDRDKNIVELIARKNLKNETDKNFGSHQLLEISEIGVPTRNIEREFNKLRDITGIGIYDGGFEHFCAIGDENGLFICIDRENKNWYPTNDKAFPSEFDLELLVKGKPYQVDFKNESIVARSL